MVDEGREQCPRQALRINLWMHRREDRHGVVPRALLRPLWTWALPVGLKSWKPLAPNLGGTTGALRQRGVNLAHLAAIGQKPSIRELVLDAEVAEQVPLFVRRQECEARGIREPRST